MYEYNAVITHVVDGDTFDVEVDLGFNVFYNIRVRLLDIDTPEIRVSKSSDEHIYGNICKYYAIKFFEGKKCIIRSKLDKDIKSDSFGRYLIYCFIDGVSLVDIYNSNGMNKLSETYSLSSMDALNCKFNLIKSEV